MATQHVQTIADLHRQFSELWDLDTDYKVFYTDRPVFKSLFSLHNLRSLRAQYTPRGRPPICQRCVNPNISRHRVISAAQKTGRSVKSDTDQTGCQQMSMLDGQRYRLWVINGKDGLLPRLGQTA